VISHWDDVDAVHRGSGHISGHWQSLTGGRRTGSGCKRIRIDPGKWSTPLHLEGRGGDLLRPRRDGRLVQADGSARRRTRSGRATASSSRARARHTLQAGPNGLDVLAFGERHYAANTLLPRAGSRGSADVGARGKPRRPPVGTGDRGRPAEVGELVGASGADRQRRDVEPRRVGASVARAVRDLGRAAGSDKTGMQLVDVRPAISRTRRTATAPRRRSSSSSRAAGSLDSAEPPFRR
jgi:hypothetical protein